MWGAPALELTKIAIHQNQITASIKHHKTSIPDRQGVATAGFGLSKDPALRRPWVPTPPIKNLTISDRSYGDTPLIISFWAPRSLWWIHHQSHLKTSTSRFSTMESSSWYLGSAMWCHMHEQRVNHCMANWPTLGQKKEASVWIKTHVCMYMFGNDFDDFWCSAAGKRSHVRLRMVSCSCRSFFSLSSSWWWIIDHAHAMWIQADSRSWPS